MNANKDKKEGVKTYDVDAGTPKPIVLDSPLDWNLMQLLSTIRVNSRPFAVPKQRCANNLMLLAI